MTAGGAWARFPRGGRGSPPGAGPPRPGGFWGDEGGHVGHVDEEAEAPFHLLGEDGVVGVLASLVVYGEGGEVGEVHPVLLGEGWGGEVRGLEGKAEPPWVGVFPLPKAQAEEEGVGRLGGFGEVQGPEDGAFLPLPRARASTSARRGRSSGAGLPSFRRFRASWKARSRSARFLSASSKARSSSRVRAGPLPPRGRSAPPSGRGGRRPERPPGCRPRRPARRAP